MTYSDEEIKENKMKKQKAKKLKTEDALINRALKQRNYKATDATRINIDALKKRVTKLELMIEHVYKRCFSE